MAVVKKSINELIGKNIAEARRMRKLTQQELAEIIGVTNQFISDVERGITGCSVESIRNICLALDVSADFILFSKPSNDYNAVLAEKLSDWSVEELDALSKVTDILSGKLKNTKNENSKRDEKSKK